MCSVAAERQSRECRDQDAACEQEQEKTEDENERLHGFLWVTSAAADRLLS
jgi:fructosamine-3-kinase